eukprot:g11578.t1
MPPERHSFLGLLPCSASYRDQLRNQVLSDAASAKASKLAVKSRGPSPHLRGLTGKQAAKQKRLFPRPDLSAMLSIQAGLNSNVPLQPQSLRPPQYFNGQALPQPLSHLLNLLPDRQCYQGPYVQLNQLWQILQSANMPSIGLQGERLEISTDPEARQRMLAYSELLEDFRLQRTPRAHDDPTIPAGLAAPVASLTAAGNLDAGTSLYQQRQQQKIKAEQDAARSL